MSKTVIEQLAVELGLDPSKFVKGMQEAAKGTKETESTVKKSAAVMGSAFASVAKEVIGLFLVFKGVKDVIGYFTDLNDSLRHLAIDSRNLDQGAQQMKSWQNLAQLAGGSAEDATKFIAGLEKQIFDVFNGATGGSFPEQLKQFQMIGVQAFDATTQKARNFKDIIFETVEALRKYREIGDRRGANPFQEAGVLGFAGGLQNMIAKAVIDPNGLGDLKKQFAEQERMNTGEQGIADAAEKLGIAWDRLKQKMERIASVILGDLSGSFESLFRKFGDFVGSHQKDIEGGINNVLDWFQGPGPGKVIDAFVQLGEAALSVAKFINHPWDTVKGNISQSFSNANTSAQQSIERNKAERAAGIPEGSLDRAGVPSSVDPSDAAKSIKSYHDMIGSNGDPRKAWNDAEEAYRGQAADLASQVTPSPGAASRATALKGERPTASNGPSTTTISVGEVNVITSATDADGIAADIGPALRRKLNVSYADTGLS